MQEFAWFSGIILNGLSATPLRVKSIPQTGELPQRAAAELYVVGVRTSEAVLLMAFGCVIV